MGRHQHEDLPNLALPVGDVLRHSTPQLPMPGLGVLTAPPHLLPLFLGRDDWAREAACPPHTPSPRALAPQKAGPCSRQSCQMCSFGQPLLLGSPTAAHRTQVLQGHTGAQSCQAPNPRSVPPTGAPSSPSLNKECASSHAMGPTSHGCPRTAWPPPSSDHAQLLRGLLSWKPHSGPGGQPQGLDCFPISTVTPMS